jgi:hypothetical protein
MSQGIVAWDVENLWIVDLCSQGKSSCVLEKVIPGAASPLDDEWVGNEFAGYHQMVREFP